jgi:hypothetical protein
MAPKIVIEIISDNQGKKKYMVARISGFPTTEEILKTCPEYFKGDHICMDESIPCNVLCIRSSFADMDIREHTELMVLNEDVLRKLMSHISSLLKKWRSMSSRYPPEIMTIDFSGDGCVYGHGG